LAFGLAFWRLICGSPESGIQLDFLKVLGGIEMNSYGANRLLFCMQERGVAAFTLSSPSMVYTKV
jgi:hypothetical protein